jgi:hypothetical protein
MEMMDHFYGQETQNSKKFASGSLQLYFSTIFIPIYPVYTNMYFTPYYSHTHLHCVVCTEELPDQSSGSATHNYYAS